MIFQPDMIALIKDRRKTQTRQPKITPTCPYDPGRTYQAQPGHGKKGLLEITILAVRQEPLSQISLQDARREGFRFPAEFIARWRELHGSADPDQLVWVITFATGDLRDRFDHPRLLTSVGHVGHVDYDTDEHGRHQWPDDDHTEDYTSVPFFAMGGNADPGEGLTEAELKIYVEDARRRDDIRRRAEQATKPLSERVTDIERRAQDGDRQAQRHLHVIGQRVARAERKTSRDNEAA